MVNDVLLTPVMTWLMTYTDIWNDVVDDILLTQGITWVTSIDTMEDVVNDVR